MQKISFICFFTVLLFSVSAQESIHGTFKDTRVINAHSVETLGKGKLDVRIGHRFGDMFGANGGWPTFYGLETAADVMIGAEYGVTDRIQIGLNRTKAAGDLKRLVNGLFKIKLVGQNADGKGISLVFVQVGSVSTMEKGDNVTAINYFDKFTHRMAFSTQLIAGKKFSDNFSLQLTPAYTHRNVVVYDDTNGIFSLGLASRIQMTKVIGLILDVTVPLNGNQSPFTNTDSETEYFPILGVGFEFDTGGHVFQLNFTNSMGISSTDYIPNTTSNWLDGGFRMGFTISRVFNL